MDSSTNALLHGGCAAAAALSAVAILRSSAIDSIEPVLLYLMSVSVLVMYLTQNHGRAKGRSTASTSASASASASAIISSLLQIAAALGLAARLLGAPLDRVTALWAAMASLLACGPALLVAAAEMEVRGGGGDADDGGGDGDGDGEGEGAKVTKAGAASDGGLVPSPLRALATVLALPRRSWSARRALLPLQMFFLGTLAASSLSILILRGGGGGPTPAWQRAFPAPATVGGAGVGWALGHAFLAVEEASRAWRWSNAVAAAARK